MRMSRFPRARDLALWPVLFALLPIACSRPAWWNTDDPSSAENKSQRISAAVPFDDSRSLPAGTLLTVRLKNQISADYPGFTGVFDAVVDEAILVEGNELLPRGAGAAGRVESARTSELKRNRGYVRLTLDSVNIQGRELPIQTASLFVHGNTGETQPSGNGNSPQVIRLASGRRLTFRLTEPLSITSPPDTPVH